jgi:peptide deformylase
VAIRPIRTLGDPVLRQKAKRVSRMDDSLLQLFDDMVDTMRDAPGVGLAAPQIGVSLRMIVIEVPEHPLIKLWNPEIVRRTGTRTVPEGCLSVPGYRADVPRSMAVVAKGRDPEGKEVRFKATDLLAQAFEHEIDHINGTLYIDYLESPEQLRKLEPEEESGDEDDAAAES